MSNTIPKWLDDEFSVLPTNYVVARNAGVLNPAAGAAATVAAPAMTVQKSGVFLIFVHVVASTPSGAGHKATVSCSGTDSFVSPFAPQVPAVADSGGTEWIIAGTCNVDVSGLARGQTVTYTAKIQPVAGGDSVSVAANGLQIVVVEL